jgi:hypothetical protein
VLVSTQEQMAEAQEFAHDCIEFACEAGNACFDGDRTDLRGFAGTFIARAAQSVASANLLAQHGLVGDAMSCGRTTVEMAIDFAYIARPESHPTLLAATAMLTLIEDIAVACGLDETLGHRSNGLANRVRSLPELQ